jgi:ATP-dependent protease Clp ATPase subunit
MQSLILFVCGSAFTGLEKIISGGDRVVDDPVTRCSTEEEWN